MTSPDFPRRSAFAQTPPHLLPTSKVSKAPQFNPYDKFTQDEFDAWIGGITSSLKRALGQENELVSTSEPSLQCQDQFQSSDEEEVERLVQFTGDSSDEEAEASFSSSSVRRVSKGKARDPRDGPGFGSFGRGGQGEPIFIDSDSEEDDKADDDDDDDNEEEEVITGWDSQSEEGDEKDIDWKEAESSVQARIRREKQTVVEVTEEEDEENEEEAGDEEEGDEEGSFEGDEHHGEDDENDYEAPYSRQASSPVLAVSSDEDGVHQTASQGRAPDKMEYAVEYFDEDTTLPLSTSIRIGPPRYRAKQQHHASPMETRDTGMEDYKDIQPLEDDTSFPSRQNIPPANEDRSVELRDCWAGPEMYAEDYYSGGEVRESPDLTTDFLGMEHKELQANGSADSPQLLSEQHQHPVDRHNEMLQVQDVLQLDDDEVDEVQPPSRDTSFPPKITEDNHFQLHQPIEIPDPWAGPKTYAQDFYSGGDVRSLQKTTLDPHQLGDNDESVTLTPTPQHELAQPQEEVNRVDEINKREAQPPSKVDAVDVSSNTIYESPQLDYIVELSEPWDGSIDYEEDYSAEVEVKSSLQMAENQSGFGDDSNTPMIVDLENNAVPVKLQDATGITNNAEESTEPALNHMEPPVTSVSEDSLVQSTPVQAEDSNVLDDIAATEELQHFVVYDPSGQSQDDVPVLDWTNDPALIHDMPTSTITITNLGQTNFDDSTSGSIQIDLDKEVVKEIAERCVECVDVPALEIQLPTAELSTEKAVETFEQVPNEDHSEVGSKITSEADGQVPNEDYSEAGLRITFEASEVGLALPQASLASMEAITHLRSVQHDKERGISSLPALAHDETETGDRFDVDIDLILSGNLVAPEIQEVNTDIKVDVGGDKMPLDLDAVPEVHYETLTQDVIVKCIEVLDGDSATLADVAPREPIFDISEPAAVAGSDQSPPTLETELIVPQSAPPTIIEGLQSTGGDANISASIDTCGPDSQIALASQDNLSQASADLAEYSRLTSKSQSQPLDPTIDNQSPSNINKPLQPSSEPTTHHVLMPSSPETSQAGTSSNNQNLSDSLAVQSPIPNSDMVSAPSDQQNEHALFSYPRSWIDPCPMNVVMRKASEPVLFADPYPASLSTPDDGDRGYATSYEQLFRQSFPSSPKNVPEGNMAEGTIYGETHSQWISAADNSVRDTYVQSNDEVPLLQQDDSMKVEFASDIDSTFAKPATTALSASSTSTDLVVDTIARDTSVQPKDEIPLLRHDDSTKVELANDADITFANSLTTALSSPPTSKDSKKSLELNGSSNSTSMVYESVAKDEDNENAMQHSSPLSSPVVECANGPSTSRVRSPPLEDDLPSILIIKKVHADNQTPVKLKAGRPQKRKRSSSITKTSFPRAGSLKKLDKNKAAPHLPAKPLGSRKASKLEKGKEIGISPISQGSFDTQSISSRSSSDASVARHMLETSSRGTSRASSIASISPSDNSSSNIQRSPTLGKGSSFRQQFLPPPPPPQVPLLHRHHHNRPQPSRPVTTQRASLSARQHDSASAEQSTSKQSSSSLHRHPTYLSSPVTRSNCRYHKISIPLDDESDEECSGDEDVKLVYFLVPGCSLGNKELNRDEKIVDHGDAQPSDGLLMTSDLDAYAFNAPLLSVLRLLVGVDMLREGEIYYLPLPNSDWVPRKVRDPSTKSTDHGPTSHITPRRNSNMSTSSIATVNAPVSSVGSASILAPFKPMKPSSIISQTSSELTEVEDSPQSKRSRFSPVEDSTDTVDPESSSRSRKSEHFGQDAAEDRPNPQDENDLNDHAIGRVRLTKGNKHSLKRSRTSDVIQEPDVDGQKSKKHKTGADLRTA
ncbi:hypothetical protein H2248_004585 [Termitomyces sp. 'cryptogamus']|nr:hypothetical protein H2248_004585 [Termitomyces sp. 'cryptogamus']